ncbi:Uncharacterised protein [Segatella copri]|nr:Uncharacterised protein [Segatella copri]
MDANILQNLDNAKYLNEINIIIDQITELRISGSSVSNKSILCINATRRNLLTKTAPLIVFFFCLIFKRVLTYIFFCKCKFLTSLFLLL